MEINSFIIPTGGQTLHMITYQFIVIYLYLCGAVSPSLFCLYAFDKPRSTI